MKTRDEERIGSYVLGREIGRGAAGIVRSATSPDLAGPVAVKILREDLVDDEESIAGFLREKELFSSVAHSNVVRVHDLVVDANRVGIVMELLEGGDLRSLMQAGTLAPTETIGIVRKIADGLAQIHAADVLHRDLKPANVLIAGPPDDRTVKITDFGISTLVGEAENYGSQSLGSPLYMAPEVTGSGSVGTAADVYSLGVLLFEMLTGHTPFQAENVLAVVLAHSQRPAPELAGIPTELSSLVAEMLQKSPADRPSLSDVIVRLRALAPLIDDEMLPAASSPLPGRVAPTRHLIGAQGPPWEADLNGPDAAAPASFAAMAMVAFDEVRTRHRLAISAVATVLILLIGITLFLNGDRRDEPSEQTRTLFEPELRNDVLLVTRDWIVDDDGALVSTTLLTNVGTEPLTTEYLEILPPGLEEDVVGRIEFTVPPASFDSERSIATFALAGIDTRETVVIGYRFPLVGKQREAGLEELAARAHTNEISALTAAGGSTRPLTYRAISIAPGGFELVVGSASSAALFAEPHDAPGLWLELPFAMVEWRVGEPSIVTLDGHGVLNPVAEGTTIIEAEFDVLTASAWVRVSATGPEILASADDDSRNSAVVNAGEGPAGGSSGGASATFPGGHATIPPDAPVADGRRQTSRADQRGATTRRSRPASPDAPVDTVTTLDSGTTIDTATTIDTGTIDPASATLPPGPTLPGATPPLVTSSTVEGSDPGATSTTEPGIAVIPVTIVPPLVTLVPTVLPAIPVTTTTGPGIGPPAVTSAPTTTEAVTTTRPAATVVVTTAPVTTAPATVTTTPAPVVTTTAPVATTTEPTTATTEPAAITTTAPPPSPPTTDDPVQTTAAPGTTAPPASPGPRPTSPSNTRPTRP